eukprot:TRINITY_DN2588_c0_g1_i1.p1 TRINITY_DN2588_c0_g1~~TRINITY_DN2588_c0_g1_i1.p1  ORF type:complete len:366 (+),score=21.67 TRINITY_DN2588_c0_g1_i1:55-1152(+)
MGCLKHWRRLKALVLVVLHYFDFVSDVLVTLSFFDCGDKKWAYMSLAFIVAPLVATFIMAYGLIDRVLYLTNTMVLAQFFSGWSSGYPPVKTYKMKHAKLMESILESMPQLMLQAYVVIFSASTGSKSDCVPEEVSFVLLVSILGSLGSIAIALSGHRAQIGWARGFLGYLVVVVFTSCEAFVRATTVVLYGVALSRQGLWHLAIGSVVVAFFFRLVPFLWCRARWGNKISQVLIAVLEILQSLMFLINDNGVILWYFMVLFNLETIWMGCYVYYIFDWRAENWTEQWWYPIAAVSLLGLIDVCFLMLRCMQCYYGHVDKDNDDDSLGSTVQVVPQATKDNTNPNPLTTPAGNGSEADSSEDGNV